jgi:hypothetical protein
MVTPGHNTALEAMLKELGWSSSGFATRISDHLTHGGHPAKVATTTVTRWLKGAEPKLVLARAACEVLTVALRDVAHDPLRPEVEPSTLGWTDDAQDLVDASLEYKDVGHAISVSTGLWRAVVMDRREVLVSALSIPAFAVASREALVMLPDVDVSRAGQGRVGFSDVELLTTQTRNYEHLDARFGGGRVVRDFASFLDNHAGPMLNGTYDDKVGRALFKAVASAQILLGWMCHDSGANGAAQRTHMNALKYAEAIGDKGLITRVFVHQARLVAESGERKEALKVARSAVLAATEQSPVVRSYAAITEARAWAHVGSAAETVRAVNDARVFGDQQGDVPEWLAWFDKQELEGQAAWAFAMAGNPDAADEALQVAHGKSASMKRDKLGLVITEAEIARLRGEHDEQVALTKRAVELAADVTSGRVAKRVERLKQGVAVDAF